jgi:hypothetical protein
VHQHREERERRRGSSDAEGRRASTTAEGPRLSSEGKGRRQSLEAEDRPRSRDRLQAAEVGQAGVLTHSLDAHVQEPRDTSAAVGPDSHAAPTATGPSVEDSGFAPLPTSLLSVREPAVPRREALVESHSDEGLWRASAAQHEVRREASQQAGGQGAGAPCLRPHVVAAAAHCASGL